MTSALFGIVAAALLRPAAPVAAQPTAPTVLQLTTATASQPASLWQFLSAAQAKRLGAPRLKPRQYRVAKLNLPALRRELAATPAEGPGPLLRLPLPDGSLATFRMRATSVMAPELAARYPELRTYAGEEAGQPANSVRLELTPTGLRAMLIRQGRTFFIEPYRPNDTQHYLCFDKASLPAGSKQGFEAAEKPTR